ncbi:TetR/AcrR family transcriptional regulator [Streptomyces sp. ST2-7A]|uniref:TetR/AcrR family transcriptional regulator n=1 Tax=Streptomyces sp. ST2-7A TaxID=2907214 RepID=UPI001F176811|nr:TetR/AcrR family transcriptional regulator [Streptomyces sp. ST2-7A]MCE7080994.1 TetR/AcrR family transcriptional regulator [Streptomyces sp. ST2-7A]
MVLVDGRERRGARTRDALRAVAFRLFLAEGYEKVTVARIAAEAGVSHMTFFRHFPTKEDVVLRDEYDPLLEELVRSRPADHPPVERIRHAVTTALPEVYRREREALYLRARLILRTPALRARMGESAASSSLAFERGLTPPGERPPPSVRVIAAACTAALTTAITLWVEEEGRSELPDLVEDAFDALLTGDGGPS